MKKIILTIALAFTYFLTSAQVYYGLFEEGLPNNNTRLATIQTELGKKPGLCLMFMWYDISIDVAGCNNLISKGITPIVTLEPGVTYANVIKGNYDAYFRKIAGQLKQIKGPVFFRYAHEMNGNWYTWDGYHNGANAAAATAYINAWRHVHNIIATEQKATNVLWNWCVNGSSWPNETWNEHMDYYPGDAYVDWIGFDSYDKPYNSNPYNYKSLETVFGTVYSILTKAVPDKPILVGEFASENYGHETDPHKLDFFTKGGPALFEKYPRIHAFSYFNVSKQNSGRWNDYRISNPAACLPVFKDYWISNVNVVSGNAGIENLHKYKTLTKTAPLKIEAEYYFDMKGIKNEACSEGGLNAGSIAVGDYMDYLIDIASAGTYTCSLRVASAATTGKIDIKNQTGTVLASYAQTNSTGGDQTWETITINLKLTAGKQKLRIYYSGAGLNLNWFELNASTDPLLKSYYHLINKQTDDYICLKDSSSSSEVAQYESETAPLALFFEWEFQSTTTTGYYYILNRQTGNAIQPIDGSVANSTGLSQVALTTTNRNNYELQWELQLSDETTFYLIKNRKSGLYLHPANGLNGTGIAIVQDTLSSTDASFKWSLVSGELKDDEISNAIKEYTHEKLQFYPNPVEGNLTIELNEDNFTKLKIVDVSGRMVKSLNLPQYITSYNIDLSNIEKGIYFLIFSNTNETLTRKLIRR